MDWQGTERTKVMSKKWDCCNLSCPFSSCLSFGSVATAGWDRFLSHLIIDLCVRKVEKIADNDEGQQMTENRDSGEHYSRRTTSSELQRQYGMGGAHRSPPRHHSRATAALTRH